MNRTLNALAILLASAAVPSLAFAQAQAGSTAPATEEADSTEGTLTDIIVTAERREQNLQDVPISITAFSTEELRNRSVTSIADIQSGTPNVHFNPSTQGSTNLTIGIRGIKNGSVELSNEQPVATYVDGVYQGTPLGAALLLGPDVASIEVLRGPQGTLFGRNTVGGALTIATQQPGNEFEGRAMLGIGNHERREAQGMINVPLGEIAALRVNFARTKTNGFSKNLTTGKPIGDTNLSFVRGQLRINPAPNLELVARGHYFKDKSGGQVFQGIYLAPSPNSAFRAGAINLGLITLGGGAPPASLFPAVQAAYFACGNGPKANTRSKCYGAENRVGSRYREWSSSLTATLDLTDDIAFKSISSYTDYKQNSANDFDASNFGILWNNSTPYGHVFTQEGQLNGTLLADRLHFASGVFYYRHKNNDQANNDVLSPLAGASSRATLDSFHVDRSIGVYGQGTYDLTDSLRFTLGGRYTSEKKKADTTQFRVVPRTCTIPVPNAACVASTQIKFDSWDYTVGADYDLSERILLYARVAKGFLAGGINQRSTTGVPFLTYDPQTSINYEVGLKGDFLDRRLRANLAIFQTDVTGLQKSVPRSFLGVNGLPVSVVALINAAKARVRGFELEVTAAPSDHFQVVASVGHLDPKYKKFLVNGPAGPNTLDLSDTNFFQTPAWTVGVSPRVMVELPFGELRAQIDYYLQSDEDLAPPVTFPLVVAGRTTIQDGYGLLNARAALKLNEGTEVAVWGKNLANKHYFNTMLDVSNSIGFISGKVGDPRTYGITVTHDF